MEEIFDLPDFNTVVEERKCISTSTVIKVLFIASVIMSIGSYLLCKKQFRKIQIKLNSVDNEYTNTNFS